MSVVGCFTEEVGRSGPDEECGDVGHDCGSECAGRVEGFCGAFMAADTASFSPSALSAGLVIALAPE